MRVGALKRRITVQRRVVTNVGGVGQETWPVLYARVAAQVESRQEQQEQVIDGTVQTQTVRRYVVHTRYLPGVGTTHRLAYHHPEGDRVLQILGVSDVGEDQRWMRAECVEVRV